MMNAGVTIHQDVMMPHLRCSRSHRVQLDPFSFWQFNFSKNSMNTCIVDSLCDATATIVSVSNDMLIYSNDELPSTQSIRSLTISTAGGKVALEADPTREYHRLCAFIT